MSNTDLNTLKHRLRAKFSQAWAEVRDWNQFHSPKNLTMALSAEVAEITEHLTNHGCSNVVGAGRTGTAQWLTEEQSKNLPENKLKEVETELADKLDIDLMAAATAKFELNAQRYTEYV